MSGGTVIYDILAYVKRASPKVLMFESVMGLVYKHKAGLLYILKTLKNMKGETGQCTY